MKKLLCFLPVFICVLAVYAQAPVMDSTWFPKAGDKYYLYRIDNQNPVTTNDTGANVTWDFSQLQFQYYPNDSFDYANPADRNITCANQESNLINGGLTVHHCLIKYPKGLYLTESNYLQDSTDVIYSKPDMMMKSTWQFRQQIWDTTKFHHQNPGLHIDSPWRGIILSHRVYDGYGILKLPGIQYDSAIRIHITSMDKDTISDTSYAGNNNNRNDSSIDYYDYYEWYVPSIHYWVLKIFNIAETNWESGVYDTVEIDKYLYLAQPTDANDLNIQQLNSITANYGQDNIVLHGIMFNNLEVSLYDVQGKLLFSGKPDLIGNGRATIPLNVSQGMYLLKVQNTRGISRSFKIVKTD